MKEDLTISKDTCYLMYVDLSTGEQIEVGQPYDFPIPQETLDELSARLRAGEIEVKDQQLI